MKRSFASAAAATLAFRSALRLPPSRSSAASRQFALVFRREQRNLSDVVEIQADGIIHDACYNRSWWSSFRGLFVPDGTSTAEITASAPCGVWSQCDRWGVRSTWGF